MGLPIVMNSLPGGSDALMVRGLTLVTTNTILPPGLAVLDAAMKRGGTKDAAAGAGRRAWRVLNRCFLSGYTLVATAIGLAAALSGIPVWEPLDRTARNLGFLGPACMMLSPGMSLRAKLALALGHGLRPGLVRGQLRLLLWKLVLVPLPALALLVLTGCAGLWVGVTVIIPGSSTATVTAVYADICRARPEEAALNVVLSTVAGLAALAAWIWAPRGLGYLG